MSFSYNNYNRHKKKTPGLQNFKTFHYKTSDILKEY